jgi:putative flavoprotein involved in K+ transport
VPGDPNGYPTKDEMADYLEMYANHYELPVVLRTGIRRLERVDGGFRTLTEAGEPIDCQAVVLATGAGAGGRERSAGRMDRPRGSCVAA